MPRLETLCSILSIQKIFYNWETNKAEKCVFCYPRLENGLPQICAETCVGRMRYVGVVFYDMDKVEEMAATKMNKTFTKIQLS